MGRAPGWDSGAGGGADGRSVALPGREVAGGRRIEFRVLGRPEVHFDILWAGGANHVMASSVGLSWPQAGSLGERVAGAWGVADCDQQGEGGSCVVRAWRRRVAVLEPRKRVEGQPPTTLRRHFPADRLRDGGVLGKCPPPWATLAFLF